MHPHCTGIDSNRPPVGLRKKLPAGYWPTQRSTLALLLSVAGFRPFEGTVHRGMQTARLSDGTWGGQTSEGREPESQELLEVEE